MNRVSTKNLFTDNYTFPCVVDNWEGISNWKTQTPIVCKPGTQGRDDHDGVGDCEEPCCSELCGYVFSALWYRGKTRTDKDGR